MVSFDNEIFQDLCKAPTLPVKCKDFLFVRKQ